MMYARLHEDVFTQISVTCNEKALYFHEGAHQNQKITLPQHSLSEHVFWPKQQKIRFFFWFLEQKCLRAVFFSTWTGPEFENATLECNRALQHRPATEPCNRDLTWSVVAETRRSAP